MTSDPTPSETDRTNRRFGTRRKFLLSTGAATTVGIAGCSGGGGNDTTTTGSGETTDGEGTTSSGRADQTWIDDTRYVPTDNDFNPWSLTGSTGRTAEYIFDQFAYLNDRTLEYAPGLAASWEFRPEANELKISLKDTKWHDGTDFTSKDVATHLRIDKYFGSNLWDFIDHLELPDDRTLLVKLSGSLNEELVLLRMLSVQPRTKYDQFKEPLDKLQSAEADGDDAAMKDAKKQVQEMSLTEPVGYSVWQVTDMSSSNVFLKPFEDHEDASKIKFNEIQLKYLETNQNIYSAFISGNLDSVGIPVPVKLQDQFPESTVRYTLNGTFTSGIAFNFDDRDYGNRNVRKAIALAIDNGPAAENAGEFVPVPIQCGIVGYEKGIPKQYLGDVYDKLEDLSTQDRDRAAEYLKKEGYSRNSDGKWVRPDGEPLKAPVLVPGGWSDQMRQCQTVVGQLQDFGIEATLRTKEASTVISDRQAGKFRISYYFQWGVYPVQRYQHLWNTPEGRQKIFSYPSKVKDVAAPFSLDNEKTTIDAGQLVSDLRSTSDEAKGKEIIQKLAWAYNQELNGYEISNHPGDTFMNSDDWDLPATDDPVVELGSVPMAKLGVIKPK